MSGEVDSYQVRIDAAFEAYQNLLANASSTPYAKAAACYKWQLMKSEYEKKTSSGGDAAVWESKIDRRVQREFKFENEAESTNSNTAMALAHKQQEIDMLGKAIEENPELIQTAWPADQRGPYQLWFPDRFNPQLRIALKRFNVELQDWVATHPLDEGYLKMSKEEVLFEFMRSRPILLIMLRLTQPDNIPGLPTIEQARAYETAYLRLQRNSRNAAMTGADRFTPEHQRQLDESKGTGGNNRRDQDFQVLNSDQLAQSLNPTGPPEVNLWEDPKPEAPAEPESYWKPEGTETPIPILITDMVLTCLPWGIGHAYTGLEVAFGYNIFGYPLTKTDRAILGAAALVPYAAKYAILQRNLAKAAVVGATVTTESAAKIAGSVAGEALGAGAEASARAMEQTAAKMASLGAESIATILEATAIICKRRKLSAALAVKVQRVLAALVAAKPQLARRISIEALELFVEIFKKVPKLAELDAQAIARIAEKVGNAQVRGQIVEELFTLMIKEMSNGEPARILTKWFGKAAAKALKAGEEIVFLEGHKITDLARLQLTDGVLAVREVVNVGGKLTYKLRIFAVFETKAGPKGARDLAGLAIDELSKVAQWDKLHPDTQVQLLEEATRRYETMLAHGGTLSIEQVLQRLMQEVWDYGESQVVRDMNRLLPELGSNNVRKILVEGIEHEVSLERGLQFFGVAPEDAKAAFEGVRPLLRQKGFEFVFLPVQIIKAELDFVADAVVKLLNMAK